MNVPSERTGKATGDLSPFVPAAGTFAARRADAGVISRRTDGSTGPAPGKRPESSGGGSKRTVIWGMSAKANRRNEVLVNGEKRSGCFMQTLRMRSV